MVKLKKVFKNSYDNKRVQLFDASIFACIFFLFAWLAFCMVSFATVGGQNWKGHLPWGGLWRCCEICFPGER